MEGESRKRKYPSDKAYFIAKEILTTERTYKKDLEVINLVSVSNECQCKNPLIQSAIGLLEWSKRDNICEISTRTFTVPWCKSAQVTSGEHKAATLMEGRLYMWGWALSVTWEFSSRVRFVHIYLFMYSLFPVVAERGSWEGRRDARWDSLQAIPAHWPHLWIPHSVPQRAGHPACTMVSERFGYGQKIIEPYNHGWCFCLLDL